MPLDLSALESSPRLLIEATLKPLQGTRFQPTGFPNLGAATYKGPDGTDMLLVESAQSVANNLEGFNRTNGAPICWNPVANDWVNCLKNLPYVRVQDEAGNFLTNSILESHRLNSSYILDATADTVNSDNLVGIIEKHLGRVHVNDPSSTKELAKLVFRYCPNTLIHGVFFSNTRHKKKIGNGRLRLPRVLGGFIEADRVMVASSGGARLDGVDASGDSGGSSETGYGNVLYARDEYVSPDIRAFFNLDLDQIRSFGMGGDVENFMYAFALYKIQRFLAVGLRLRTACDLDLVSVVVTRPVAFGLPPLTEIEDALPDLIKAVGDAKDEKGKSLWSADDRVTRVVWKSKVGAKNDKATPLEASSSEEPDTSDDADDE